MAFSRALLARGHTVDVITARTDPVASAVPVRIHRLNRLPISSTLRMLDFAWRSGKHRRSLPHSGARIDLSIGFGRTIAHDMHRAGGGCHAVYSRLLPPARRFGLKNRIELLLERRLYTSGKTRHFVVNAAKVRAELQNAYQIIPTSCTVIHTAVDTARYHPTHTEEERHHLRKELGMPHDRTIALFVSSSHRRKGLGRVIDALAAAPELEGMEVWIAGKGPDSRHGQQARRIPGMPGRLRFLGERADLPILYRAADVFVHPTLYDACANTVLQAMASGLPAIVSAADGAAEFVRDGINGFLLRDPVDATELRAHLKSACALAPESRRRLGAAARDGVLPLTWDAHVAKWEELFAQLAEPSE